MKKACNSTHGMYRLFLFVLVLSAAMYSPVCKASAATVKYTYDDNRHLVKARYDGNYVSYSFDKNQNILTRTTSGNFSWLLFLPAIVTNTTSGQSSAGSRVILQPEK